MLVYAGSQTARAATSAVHTSDSPSWKSGGKFPISRKFGDILFLLHVHVYPYIYLLTYVCICV